MSEEKNIMEQENVEYDWEETVNFLRKENKEIQQKNESLQSENTKLSNALNKLYQSYLELLKNHIGL